MENKNVWVIFDRENGSLLAITDNEDEAQRGLVYYTNLQYDAYYGRYAIKSFDETKEDIFYSYTTSFYISNDSKYIVGGIKLLKTGVTTTPRFSCQESHNFYNKNNSEPDSSHYVYLEFTSKEDYDNLTPIQIKQLVKKKVEEVTKGRLKFEEIDFEEDLE